MLIQRICHPFFLQAAGLGQRIGLIRLGVTMPERFLIEHHGFDLRLAGSRRNIGIGHARRLAELVVGLGNAQKAFDCSRIRNFAYVRELIAAIGNQVGLRSKPVELAEYFGFGSEVRVSATHTNVFTRLTALSALDQHDIALPRL